MCTPENLRENCSCPYITRMLARRVAWMLAIVATVAGMWSLAAAGYAWTVPVVGLGAGAVGSVLVARRLWRSEIRLVHRYRPELPPPAPAPVQWWERAQFSREAEATPARIRVPHSAATVLSRPRAAAPTGPSPRAGSRG